MRRRLLQRLEQRVERRRGEHVHLVNDIYLVPAGAWGVGRFVPQVADVVHAVVGRCVHLHHVQDAAVVNAAAHLAFAAGVAVLRMQAVDRLGKNFGASGLAGAAHPRKQVCVAHTACYDLVFEGRDDGTLTHHVLKTMRTPFAIQCAVHGRASLPCCKADTKNGQRRGGSPRRCVTWHTNAG